MSPSLNSGKQRCYQYDKVGHLAKECLVRKSESQGTTSGGSTAWKVTTTEEGLTSYLYQSNSSEDEAIRIIQMQDQGSHSCIKVLVQGYSAN